jgi:hypothetical protein
MLLIRCDPDVPGEVLDCYRPPLERAGRRWTGSGEAFLYCLREPGRGRELMVRVSTAQGVVPVVFRLDGLDPAEFETAIRGTLMRGDL